MDDTFFAARVMPRPGVAPPAPGEGDTVGGLDAKFQLAPAFDLVPNISPIRAEFTYKQTSFWPVHLPSAPFRETNYNPGGRISYRPGAFCGGEQPRALAACPHRYALGPFIFDEAALGVEHISDGEGLRSVDQTRSLNRSYAEFRFAVPLRAKDREGPTVTVADHGFAKLRIKAWHYFAMEVQNWDIARYTGYGEAEFSLGWRFLGWGHWNPAFRLVLLGQVGMRARARGNSEDGYGNLEDLKWVRRPRDASSLRASLHLDLLDFYAQREVTDAALVPSIYLQWYLGYGESLKTYDRKRNILYVGLSLLF